MKDHAITEQTPPIGAAPQLRIEAVEVIGLDIVPAHRRRMSTGAYVYSDKGGWAGRPVMVGIRAGGITGWGEARPINPFVGETAAGMFTNLRDYYAPLLIGRDAMQIEAAIRACEARLPSNPATLATIDMALHDLVGRALGVPVHTLLGGACRSEIALEWSVSLDDEKVMVSEAVRAVEKHAVRYVCIKIGPLKRRELDIRVAEAIQKEQDLIKLAKASPGRLNFGSGGIGGAPHLAGELLKSIARVDIVHVPFRGAGPALIALLSGQVDMYIGGISAVLPVAKDGRVRAIAVTSARRTPLLPEMPTFIESGVPGYEVVNWYAVLAPAATPKPVVAKLNAAIVRALASSDVKKRFADLGTDAMSSTPEQLAAHHRDDLARWAKVIKTAGIQPE